MDYSSMAICPSFILSDISRQFTLLFSIIFNCFASCRDDSNIFGNSFSSDRMVTSDHNYFNTSRSALSHSVRYSSPRGVNHGHKSNKSQSRQWKIVFYFNIKRIIFVKLILRKLKVTEAQDTLA